MPPATSAPIVADLGEMTKKRLLASAAAQTELLDALQGISQHWTARAKSETDLASELIVRLTSARSVPKGAKAYQEWASRRVQLAVEDGQRLFADSCKIAETFARGFSSGNSGTST